jgi:N,N'-diacetyllegionaminate synthase
MLDNKPEISIGSRKIGSQHPVYIIAEACDNHFGSIDRAKEMIVLASESRCDAIKFQHHLPDQEMLPDVPMSGNFSEPLYEFLKRNALTISQHAELKAYCESLGVQYLCTPFSFQAAQELVGIGVEGLKIGSGEMTDTPSLQKMAQNFGLPMIISTGMSSYEEIDLTYQLLRAENISLALLNCVSEYPPEYRDINLGVISIMKQRYPDAVIGHSDHTPDIYTTFAAVAIGAVIVEKHVILDKSQPGPDQSVSIDFPNLAMMVEGIRKIEEALGNEKKLHKKEEPIRKWAFRSIVTTKSISPGETITLNNVWSKRPGTGIPSRYLDDIIGRKAKHSLVNDHLLSWSDLESEADK